MSVGAFGRPLIIDDRPIAGSNRVGVAKNTPTEIIEKLNKETNADLADPKIEARRAALGGTVLAARPPTSESSSHRQPSSRPRLSSSRARSRTDRGRIFHKPPFNE